MKKLRKPIKCHITAGLTHYEQSQGEGKVIASVTSISNDTYDFECGLKDLQMGTCFFFLSKQVFSSHPVGSCSFVGILKSFYPKRYSVP